MGETLPILRKKSEAELASNYKPTQLVFRLYPDIEYDDEGREVNPPCFRILIIDEATGDETPMCWGPIEYAPHVQRMFATAAIGSQLLGPDELNRQLNQMGIGTPVAKEPTHAN